MEDQDEFVSLPDLNEERPDEHFFGVDSTLLHHDHDISTEDLVPDKTPFYQNQLDDPEVRAIYACD